MEEGNRAEFTVSAGEDVAAFELDFSQNEIKNTQKLYDDDKGFINRDTLRDLVAEHPFFADFFHWVRYDTPYVPTAPQKDDDGNILRKEKKGNAIPVELMSFVKLYMREIVGNRTRSIAIRKGKVPAGMEESFYKNLLQYAQAEEKNNDIEGSERYWTRHLYENTSIQKAATDELWNREYMLRAEGLYEKVKILPPDQQLAMFYRVVHFLDSEIAVASMCAAANPDSHQEKKEGLLDFLNTFPKEIISKCRKRTVASGSKRRVEYTVDNLLLSFSNQSDANDEAEAGNNIVSLKTVFTKIRGNVKELLCLKKRTRKAYYCWLNEKTQKSQFQLDYEGALTYINACSAEFSQEELRKTIASRASAYYGSAFRGQLAMPGQFLSDAVDSLSKSEVNRLIEEYVLLYYSNFHSAFKSYLDFINQSMDERDEMIAYLTDMARSLWDNYKIFEDIDEYQLRLNEYIKYLEPVMPEALRGIFILGDVIQSQDEQTLAEQIIEMCGAVLQKLGLEPAVWMDIDLLKKAFRAYNGSLFRGEKIKVFPGYGPYDVILKKALITIKVGEAIDYCCLETEKNIMVLTSAIKEIKNNHQ